MGAFNYNCLLNLDLEYTKYGLIIRANFQNEITLIARYFKPILMAVQKNLKGILRTKGRD